MYQSWQPPRDYRQRPVAILGAGVLGRRIGMDPRRRVSRSQANDTLAACIWASAGYNVQVRDPSPQQRADCLTYVDANVISYAQKTGQQPGTVQTFENLKAAVDNAWLVIEAVPEKLQIKIDAFAELDALAPSDCILASNSSSYKSSEMLEKVAPATRPRILNMHYYMPPVCMIVELMTDGFTEPAIFPFLAERCREGATNPYVARKESTGFIFNRLWAAVKREVLTILAEEVSVPEEIDSMWQEMFVKGGALPCRTMDNVGLDTVAFIENHYIAERGLSSEKTVDFLKQNYLAPGKLGNKCAHGGLYPPPTATPAAAAAQQPKIIVLDIGLSTDPPSFHAGQILELSADGKLQRVLVRDQALPDGLSVDFEHQRMFWTNMGLSGKDDGAVYSANLDGSDITTVVPPGATNTPKQLALEPSTHKIYFSDREGLRVFRCNYDGSDLEVLIQRGDHRDFEHQENSTRWCVGIAVAPSLGKFYWTQKGPSKSGKGRIFCADINTPEGKTATTREDITCVLDRLPEPIDLEIDEASRTLYWTDRGDIPFGNSLNRVVLAEDGAAAVRKGALGYEILTRKLNEAIGLKLDLERGHIYLTDLLGSVYRTDADGKNKVKLREDENRSYTGIALV
ncbi:putative 3-hydroxyacyl-CoA dehydrogenase [Aspergillus clavatus NRRL 1]|uniref:3-hydroxyacyl-CoA dehydrogenase, NAD binding domain, putative n=1 Tax=Aspergillus clavatus (strain ATCC 1007 / CBS 513.65 / DSM 816 / NCTC 3887 / NRRL 1 / QM 1276 / 107) TaxID=344612 RepID=A1CAX0_ASPCL|nr:3-hydroxyacyl-CoA dehydrogenase, NAD binding domain, putative [Aspergillus clavatus NRRL 1]EAW12888.1 3-hydroxyacyl-CoA dehydrogenase, NAD binding domain, putative [Aspergillus clavatus NRRL 1]